MVVRAAQAPRRRSPRPTRIDTSEDRRSDRQRQGGARGGGATRGTNPAASSRTLELIISGSDWYLLDYSREPVRDVLEGVLEAGDNEARQAARRLINSLGERGIHGMQGLLDT
jgi:hypothetical protein